MGDCCGDPIPTLYIAGTTPIGIKVSAERFDGAVPCGAALDKLTPIPIEAEQTAIGYYAKDNYLSGSEQGRGVVFGIKVKKALGETRTIRLVADYPKEFVGAPPKLARIDLTDTLLTAAFAAPPDRLFCSSNV
jgi:hypothetical protein